MSNYLRFDPGVSLSGKTKVWNVVNPIKALILGNIKWYGAWRKYCFCPNDDTIFDPDCLDEIASFMRKETLDHKRG